MTNFTKQVILTCLIRASFSGDFLSTHDSFMFSTKDQDNGDRDDKCNYQSRNGGWWSSTCGFVNLNGPYLAGPVSSGRAMHWYGWPSASDPYYSLKASSMMIKRSRERA